MFAHSYIMEQIWKWPFLRLSKSVVHERCRIGSTQTSTDLLLFIIFYKTLERVTSFVMLKKHACLRLKSVCGMVLLLRALVFKIDEESCRILMEKSLTLSRRPRKKWKIDFMFKLQWQHTEHTQMCAIRPKWCVNGVRWLNDMINRCLEISSAAEREPCKIKNLQLSWVAPMKSCSRILRGLRRRHLEKITNEISNCYLRETEERKFSMSINEWIHVFNNLILTCR